MIKGYIGRYSRFRQRIDGKFGPRATWRKVSAKFAGGSRDSGVHDSQHEMVGVASRVRSLARAAKKQLTTTKRLL